MSGLAAIREGLRANIAAAFPDAVCTGYLLSGATVVPAFEIELDPEGVEYDTAMARGVDEWQLIVRGVVGLASDVGAQKNMDVWLSSSGSRSVKAAIEADKTLGGAAHDIHVTGASGLREYGTSNGAAVYLGAEWAVRVLAPGAD